MPKFGWYLLVLRFDGNVRPIEGPKTQNPKPDLLPKQPAES